MSTTVLTNRLELNSVANTSLQAAAGFGVCHLAAPDYNLYYSTVGAASSLWDWQGKSIAGYTNYRSASGMDAHSPFADPQFLNFSSPPPILEVLSSSPAMNAGANLGSSVVGL